MKTLLTKTPTGWQHRASFSPSDESANWLNDLKAYFENEGHECIIEDDTPAVSAMGKLVEYLEADESKHYSENDEPEDHIYIEVRRVRGFVLALSNNKGVTDARHASPSNSPE